jgi:hypothetical protein
MTALSMGFQKLGQPVPLSNLVVDEKRSRAQPAQANTPARCSSLSGLVNGVSVPALRRTSYCSGVRSLRHSASEWLTSKVSVDSLGVSAPATPRSDPQPARTPISAPPNSTCRRFMAATVGPFNAGERGAGAFRQPPVTIPVPRSADLTGHW